MPSLVVGFRACGGPGTNASARRGRGVGRGGWGAAGALRVALLTVALLLPVVRVSALPADVLLVVDTSRSMADPAGGGETKLQRAKAIAAEIAAVAGERHHVGLVRFAQVEQVVAGGEGPTTLHAEDPKACVRMADLLVPLSATGAADASVWLDGVEAPGDPELAAVGDSPLVGTLSLAFDYLRARRGQDPLHACVNTYVVLLTDGKDTCAGAGDVTGGLATLAATADAEAIRVLVLSFDPEGETSKLAATIGAQGTDATPYPVERADDLVAAIAAIEGHPTPEGCVASGVPPEKVGVVPGGSGAGGGAGEAPGAASGDEGGDGGDGGCGVTGGAGVTGAARTAGSRGVGLSLLSLLLLLSVGRRAGRRGARATRGFLAALGLLALLGGCSDEGAAGGATEADSLDAVAGADATIPDPEALAAADLARIEAVAAEAARLRTEVLAPLLDPQAAFAAITGEPVAGCVALARSIGLEAYAGAQRGPAGCLATRRCNAVDKALLLRACLDSHGIAAEAVACWHTDAIDAVVPDALAAPAALLDPAPFEAAVSAAIDAVTEGAPTLGEAARLLGPAAREGLDRELADAVDADLAALQPFLDAVSPAEAAQSVAQARRSALETYAYVTAGEAALDPSFDPSPAVEPSCGANPLDVEAAKARVTLRILVQYAEPLSPDGAIDLTLLAPVVAGEVTYAPADHWGETVTVALADAAATSIAPGLPAPASGGCMRPLMQVGGDAVVRGEPFFLGVDEECAEAPVVTPEAGRHLAAVSLEAHVDVPGVGSRTFSRMLTNRYGYASHSGSLISGPMYSAESARSLLALRVDLPVIAGLPVEQAFADVLLADIVARKDRNLAAARIAWGLPTAEAPPGPTLPVVWAMLGRFAAHLPAALPAGTVASFERPWLIGLVQRRGFGASEEGGLTLEGQLILDVLDAPLRVDAAEGDAQARLDAQARAGALLTESERLAIATHGGTPLIVNAGAMLRVPDTGPWDVWGSPGHESMLFPASVQARASQTSETLVTTPGPAPFLDGEYIAWWRLDPTTGWLLGEVQLDGTFYGGAGIDKVGELLKKGSKQGVKVIADVDRCLWCTAALALEAVEFDTEQCLADALTKNGMDLAFKVGSKEAFGVTICNFGNLSDGLGKYALDMAFENLPILKDVKDLYDLAKWAKKYKTPCDKYIKQ